MTQVRLSAADATRIIAMRKAGETWAVIGRTVNRPPESCRAAFIRLVGRETEVPNAPKAWMKAEDENLQELRRRGMSFADIGARIGRTPDACGNRLSLLKKMANRRSVRDKRDHEFQPVIAASMLEEQAARRQAYYTRDPIAELLGDPPKGYSALDRKRMGAEA